MAMAMASPLLQPTPKLIGIWNVPMIKGEQKKKEDLKFQFVKKTSLSGIKSKLNLFTQVRLRELLF